MLRRLLLYVALPLAVGAQDIPAGVKYDLTDLIYPRVARLARVQGVVSLELLPGENGQEIKLLSGSPLLVEQSKANLEKWRTNRPATVNYIFSLVDPEVVKLKVAKGDAFDRFWLRIFHLATYTEQSRWQQTSSTDFSTKVSDPKVVQQSPLIIEVQVTQLTSCLLTVSSGLVASR